MASQTLNLVIKAQDKASGKIRDVNKSMKNMGSTSQGLGAKLSAMKGGLLGVTAALAGVSLATKKVINLAAQQEQAEVRLASVVKATGGAAGLSAKELFKMASAFQTATGMGDELVMEGQAILLTFKNIREDAFERTMSTALDMSAVLGTDLKGSAMQLGKALNDPKAGLTMLTRVGITFTAAQKEVVIALQETGDVAGAQAVILEELESQMGGAAAAMGDTLAGSMEKAGGAMGDLGEQIGFLLSPAVRELSDRVVILAENTGKSVAKMRQLFEAADDLGLSFFELWSAGVGLTKGQKELALEIENSISRAESYEDALENCFQATEEVAKITPVATEAVEDLSEAVEETTIVSLDIAKILKNDLAVATGKTTRQIISFEEEMEEIRKTMLKTGVVSGDLRQRYSDLAQEVQRLTKVHNRALMPMRELIVLDAQMAAGADRTKLMKAGLIPTVAGLTHEYEKVADAMEDVPMEEHTDNIVESSAATLILARATSSSNSAIEASGDIVEGVSSSLSGYTSSLNSSAAAERNLASSVRDRLAAQGAQIAPGIGVVSASGELRAAKVGEEWEEVHGEWRSGAGGLREKQHIGKVIDDMVSRHGFNPENPQKWGLDFLASEAGGGGVSFTRPELITEALEDRGFVQATAAKGISGIVPSGFPNDSFLIGATSGESVNITPAHKIGNGGGGLVIQNVNVYGVQTDSQLFSAVVRAAKQRGREFAKVM